MARSASRAIACPGWAMPTCVNGTLFLNHDESYLGNTQPHQIAYPRGGQAMARRLRLVPGLGASDRRQQSPHGGPCPKPFRRAVLQRPAFNLIHSVSPMSREREARQGIGDAGFRRGALAEVLRKSRRAARGRRGGTFDTANNDMSFLTCHRSGRAELYRWRMFPLRRIHWRVLRRKTRGSRGLCQAPGLNRSRSSRRTTCRNYGSRGPCRTR